MAEKAGRDGWVMQHNPESDAEQIKRFVVEKAELATGSELLSGLITPTGQ